jgi:hypothetical protein
MVNLQLLNANPLVVRYDVVEFRILENGFYYRCEVLWQDSSRLFARDYSTSSKRAYSFHWQDAENRCILRWDNAPHFPRLATFPHHRHNADDTVSESPPVDFDDVIREISRRLTEFI